MSIAISLFSPTSLSLMHFISKSFTHNNWPAPHVGKHAHEMSRSPQTNDHRIVKYLPSNKQLKRRKKWRPVRCVSVFLLSLLAMAPANHRLKLDLDSYLYCQFLRRAKKYLTSLSIFPSSSSTRNCPMWHTLGHKPHAEIVKYSGQWDHHSLRRRLLRLTAIMLWVKMRQQLVTWPSKLCGLLIFRN